MNTVLALSLLGMDLSFLQDALISALPLVIAGGIVVGLMKWLASPSGTQFSQYMPFVIASVHAVEKKYEGTTNPTMSKAVAFMQEFENFYTSEQGKAPDQALKDWANRMKEVVLHEIIVAKASAPVVVPAPTPNV